MTKPAKKVARSPTLKPKDAVFKYCGNTHSPIKYHGTTCPLCERGKELDAANLWVNRLSRLLSEHYQNAGLTDRLKSLDDSLRDYGLKLMALDEAIAMLVTGSEERCDKVGHVGDITGRCVLGVGHSGIHVYSVKRPSPDPTSLGN